MREEILIYVNDTFTPELKDLYIKCFDVFDIFEIEDYDNQFIDFIMDMDNSDRAIKASQFNLLVRENLLAIINEHNVNVNDEATLEAVCEIARCLSEIQNYEDGYAINRMLESDLDYVEKLAELFTFVSSYSVDYFIVNIDNVDSSIFIKLAELYVQVEENNKNVTEEIYNELRSNIIEFINFANCSDSILINKLKQGLSIGMPYSFYCDVIKGKIESLELDKAVIETAVSLQLAADTYQSPLAAYATMSGELFDSLEMITKVNVGLVKTFNDYAKYKTDKETKAILNKDQNEQK